MPLDLWVLDLSTDSALPTVYLTSQAADRDLMISPSGDLAAYTSSESADREIYVRSFPVAGEQTLVSQGGGAFPRWSPDGTTIYYWTTGQGVRTLMAAEVQTGPPFVVTRTTPTLTGAYNPSDWDLHPDGDRIVVTGPVTSASADVAPAVERFLVVVNWFEELKERMGGN